MSNVTSHRRVVRVLSLLLLAGLLCGGSCSWAFSSKTSDDDDDPDDGGMIIVVETATFGGWDLLPELRAQPGVLSARRGWDGDLPFFGEDFAAWTGHTRVVRVRFDPSQAAFPELVGVARAARLGARRVTVLAHTDAQAEAARAAFPADSLPRLRLREASAFTPRH